MRSRAWRSIGGLPAALVVLAGCTGDSTGPEAEPMFVGTWAGAAWSGDVSVDYGQRGDTMYIFGSSPVGADQNAASIVEIRILYSGTGTYVLGPSDGTFTRLVGGDGVVSRHGTFVENAGAVSIIRRDGDRIAGVAHFDARDVQDSSTDPTLVRFEGSFEAALPR